jgi:hypothetical protein
MKLVMVTTSHGHWDGLAGNTAMFSEAVVQPAILDQLPTLAVDTVFIKKDPQTRRFEKAWKGKAKNFKRVSKQDKDYISFEIEGLKKINCPEVLRTKTVGCHILTENLEPAHVAPKRPMATLPQLKDRLAEQREEAAKPVPVSNGQAADILKHKNGRVQYSPVEEEHEIITEVTFTPEPVISAPEIVKYTVSQNGTLTEQATDETTPAFFNALLHTNDPVLFEKYCFYLLRLLGVHDIHRPANHAGADAHGFFKFRTLSVVYTTTLVPGVMQENKMITDHYLNLLKKEKINFSTTSYTLQDTQKQVWVLCRGGSEQLLLRTEDDIKLKLVPVQHLITIYQQRLSEVQLNSDALWDKMKNV